MTFEFLCAGLTFETSDLVAFWFSRGQLLRPLVLLNRKKPYYDFDSRYTQKLSLFRLTSAELVFHHFGD